VERRRSPEIGRETGELILQETKETLEMLNEPPRRRSRDISHTRHGMMANTMSSR
jgi:hypothetical protein